jgi:hypothetical protein
MVIITIVFGEYLSGPPPLATPVKIMLTIWCIILMPWFPFLTLTTGMAFDGGYTLAAYLSVVIVWTYPALVGVAYFFRRRKPQLIWLPVLPLIPILASVVSVFLGQ